jgi:hypothetical protein
LIFSLVGRPGYDADCIILKSETAIDGAWESVNRENHDFSQR